LDDAAVRIEALEADIVRRVPFLDQLQAVRDQAGSKVPDIGSAATMRRTDMANGPCHAASMPTPSRRPDSGRERIPLDEAIGRYLLNNPLVRTGRERPEIAAPWIVVGLAAAVAGLIAGGTAVLLILGVGSFIIRWAGAYATRRQDQTSDPLSAVRLALILGWVAAMACVIVLIALAEGATGYTGIVTVVGLLMVLPIAGIALYLILRM